MQIPILSGTFADVSPDYRTSYPRNLVPVPKNTGISEGYLRPAEGIVAAGTGPGVDRGGINWNGVLYRVMGTKLVSISAGNVVTEIGDVGGTGRVTFTYGFEYLAVASGGNLWLYDGTTLAQVTDPDLLTVLDVVWVDGYFMTTDGEFLVVTELDDPFEVNPLKYGSSEADPDPVLALLKLRNEVYALNRYTIEVFDNVGGTGFPFQRINGAQIQKGCVGTHACCEFMDNIAFLGGGMNEAPSVFVGANGSAAKIATREIEEILQEYTEAELATAFLEARVDRAHEHLIIHLPRHCLVFDGVATTSLGVPVW
ncbi:packaged DNA stabilization protein, partial [Yoonia sp.]|uniref:packaged DNA stabilization protein n=1 Tax=Yoonia sp. TaxID=2212373 RepID=UPI002E0C6333|nr:packaged DNA stabilization protein [Yoonia sp.]